MLESNSLCVLFNRIEPGRQLMDPFRILCYNVHGFPWCSPPIQEIVAWITTNADIVALQEVWCSHSTWAAAFSAAGWVFQRPPRENQIAGLFGSGLAVAWNPAKWTASDVRFYPFLSAVGLDQLAIKGWLHLDLQQCCTGFPLRLLNTHMQSDYDLCDELWQNISEPIRMSQAHQLFSAENRLPPAPTLIVGDFNTATCWIPGARFLNPQTIPTFPAGEKFLDHIATPSKYWRLLTHEVATAKLWSDHLPVRWTVAWIPPHSIGSFSPNGTATGTGVPTGGMGGAPSPT